MNTKALLSVVVISGVLTLPHAAFSRDDDYNRGSGWSDRWNDNDVRPLQGRVLAVGLRRDFVRWRSLLPTLYYLSLSATGEKAGISFQYII